MSTIVESETGIPAFHVEPRAETAGHPGRNAASTCRPGMGGPATGREEPTLTRSVRLLASGGWSRGR